MRLRLTLEYDGTDFRGWAAQPGERTVEGTLEVAMDGVFDAWGPMAVAGRTDAGVHATGQVVSLDIDGGPPADRVAHALNALLPDDVSVRAAENVAPDFHARHSAVSRSYRYRSSDGRRRRRSSGAGASAIPALSTRSGWPTVPT